MVEYKIMVMGSALSGAHMANEHAVRRLLAAHDKESNNRPGKTCRYTYEIP